MHFITFAEAAAQDPQERLYALGKEGDTFTLIADVEENGNLEGEEWEMDYPNGLRVALYGCYGGDWTLDNEELLDPDEVATSEVCGRNAGGICFDYEDRKSWEMYENAYWCLWDNVGSAHEMVAVIDSAQELFELEDGDWFVLCSHDGVFL